MSTVNFKARNRHEHLYVSPGTISLIQVPRTEAESTEKHGVEDPMPELTITLPYVHSRVDSNTFTMGIGQPYAGVDLNPMPDSTLTL